MYVENIKELTKTPIHEFSKVAVYKTDIENSILFLYTDNEQSRIAWFGIGMNQFH